MKRKPDYSTQLAAQLNIIGCPEPELEYRFHPKRRWRFDLAWPHHGKVAVEIDGGIWTRGRHIRPKGFMRDQEKTNQAQILGWRIFRYSPQDVRSWRAAQEVASIVMGITVNIG